MYVCTLCMLGKIRRINLFYNLHVLRMLVPFVDFENRLNRLLILKIVWLPTEEYVWKISTGF